MRYTESHEWIKIEGIVGTVGVTDFAQKELGEIVHVELPKVGQKVKQGQEISVLESTKAAADVYAPVSGTVVAVNQKLSEGPSAINMTAETIGWLFKIELSNPREVDHLLTRAQYFEIVKQ